MIDVENLRRIMSNESGRQFVSEILMLSPVERSVDSTDPQVISCFNGSRITGCMLLELVKQECFEEYIQMLKEQNFRERIQLENN